MLTETDSNWDNTLTQAKNFYTKIIIKIFPRTGVLTKDDSDFCTVEKRVTNTTYQVQDDKHPTILKRMHRNHLVEYHPKGETLFPFIEDIVAMNRRHDDFCEKFMEQQIQKINNSNHSGMEDSLPFPIEPVRTAPVTVPTKRISNTSSDSGVNSFHVLSPATPITPDISQPYLIPSTARVNPPSGPLTPIQQFIHNRRKSKNKDPTYNRSQLNHPDHSLCFDLALDMAINFKFVSFFLLLFYFTHMIFSSLELITFLLSLQSFLFYSR